MTETDLNQAMEIATWTCLAAIAKESLSTKRLLRRDGTLRYGLDLEIRRKLTACSAQNVWFLNGELPKLTDDSDFSEVICVAEAIGTQLAAEYVAGFDELMDAENALPKMTLVGKAAK
jgi:hypothetical protein